MITKLIIFFIIVWQIRTVLKKVSEAATKSKPDGKQTTKPSWQDKLKDVADKIKTEMEKAQQQQSGSAARQTPEWGQILTGKDMPPQMKKREDIKPTVRQTAPYLKKTEPAISSQETAKEAISSNAERQKLTDILKKKSSQPEDTPGKKKRHQRSSLKQMTDLKKAVVWSEILSPPVSMRDESHPLRD